MTGDLINGRLLLAPPDPELAHRMARLQALGLTAQHPDPELDQFAATVAQITNAPYAMVNLVGEAQYFAGLYTPTRSRTSTALHAAQDTGHDEPSRDMARDHGFCPHVVARRKALVLDDVCDYPRFAGNPVIDQLGIRSYLGAPLIDHTDTVLGTVCAVDIEPHPWGRPGLTTIKTLATELTELINRREPSP